MSKNATENLPKNATKENIDKFTDFIMAAKDKRGRGIDDPWFDRESIDFSTFTQAVDDIPFKTGGRVGFRLGGFGGKFFSCQNFLPTGRPLWYQKITHFLSFFRILLIKRQILLQH